MLIGLITGVFLQTSALLITVLLGFGWINPPDDSPLSQHIFMAFMASLISIFVQTTVIFYIFAAGRRVRDLVSAGKWAEGEKKKHGILIARMKRLKIKLFPYIITHLFFLFFTFWMGAATHSRAIESSSIHNIFSILTISSMFILLYMEIKWLPENEALLDETWVLFHKYEKSEKQPI